MSASFESLAAALRYAPTLILLWPAIFFGRILREGAVPDEYFRGLVQRVRDTVRVWRPSR